MRQLTYLERGKIDWADVPEPALTGPADVIVEPLAVARCDLDLPMVKLGLFPGPFPVGHEVAGRVLEIGTGPRNFKIGDLVIVPFQLSCGSCPTCAQGQYAACSKYMAPIGGSFGFGSAGGNHGGGLAERLLVPDGDHFLFHAPDGIPVTTLATLSDNVVDGFRAVWAPLQDKPGAEVLVVAAAPGSIALYATAAARALGSPVRYVDRDAARVAVAARLGATVTHHHGAWPKRFQPAPITVDATGDEGGLSCILRSTERYGYCTSVAIAFEPATPVPLLDMYTRGITFHTSRADSKKFLPQVLDLMARGRFDPALIPITQAGWEDARQSWLEPAIKLVVTK